MATSYEEILKSDKDRELDRQYKNVRTALKLSVSKFVSEAGGGSFEKYLEGFIGVDPSDKSTSENKTFLDELLNIGKLMEDTFNKLGDASEAALAYRLTSTSGIYMERIGYAAKDVRLNYFPLHKEKFAMDMTEDQEAKAVVPRIAFKSIKMFLDKYYYLFRQASVNAKVKQIFVKIAEFREKFLHFEWALGDVLRRLNGQFIKEIAPFFRDTKLALLRIRKLFEAIESSNFGKVVKRLQEISKELGTRMYLRYNAVVTVADKSPRKGSSIPIKEILAKYDRFMEPIRKTVADYDNAKKAMLRRSPTSKDTKAFWDVSGIINEFREGMLLVVEEFGKGISPSDEEYKYFIYTVQAVLIPYMNQSKGEVNESFVVGVKNLDTFFWKLLIKSIELGQNNDETIEEILGVEVKLRKADIDKRKASDAAAAAEAEMEDGLGEKS